ncbi:hypothetical protein [Legionella shakespearei]|uniref:Uncharacterized protein n=1 Tax=Legionella shakespearei DSM 23087 TaxID=1122169 RepID=A0A0W0YSR1_9GAMM|nr:hypothetical protein [Legionella shakespearei]KTD59928.1 hypothetical protein Lsha_1678 [Legionella shakespearei DSM 23087]
MLVQSVLQFIKNLKEFADQIPVDKQLCLALENHFRHFSVGDELDLNDIQFILDCYKKRWPEIFNKPLDYTLNPLGINRVWIQFAKDLALCCDKKYYQILFPTVTNTVDFNNLSQLSETEGPDNFYLDQDGLTLYRKRGLCERLLNNQFSLSTCRDLSVKRVSSLSVDELAHLKVCQQAKGEFSIKEEKFINFWDFMQKKVFPNLQTKGSMPLNLLPQLLALIEEYYRLKSTGADFTLFKNTAKVFFGSLLHIETDDTNFFYGVRIPYYESEFYLLDFLITINQARSYEIDRELNVLALWLKQYNSALKSSRKELVALYDDQKQKSLIAKDANGVSEISSDPSLHRSCCTVVSLMTSSFDFLPFAGVCINLWDASNTVSSEAAGFYRLFEKALETESSSNLIPVYQSIIRNINNRNSNDSGFLSIFSQHNSLKQWLQLIDRGDFSSIDVYWFEPELIFDALFHFKSSDTALNEHINIFLDNIIQTYAQNMSDLFKAFRVNILFSGFMKKLSEHDKTNLYRLINLYNPGKCKDAFLSNCGAHIGNRLTQLSSIQANSPVHFFVSVRKLDSSKLPFLQGDLYQVRDIIEAYKQGLHAPELHLGSELIDKMFTYLRGLSRPILSVAETDVARNSAAHKDYLGAPT